MRYILEAISVLGEAESPSTSASFSAASSSAQNSEDDLLSAIDSGDADTASLIARSLARTRAEELRRDKEGEHAAASQDNPPDSPMMSAEEEARMLEDKERREKQLEEVLDQVKAARDMVEENLQSALLVQMRKDLLGGDGDEDVPREVVEHAQKQPEVWRRRVLLQLDRLEKATMQLDEVSLGQHEDLRARRRTAVKTVQQLQGRIDMLNELVLSHEQFLIVIGSRTGAFLRQ
jgi:hypothetical protein